MNEKVKKVKAGYAELTYEERKNIREFIEEFEKKEFAEKRTFSEQLRKSLGPTNTGTCPCCHR